MACGGEKKRALEKRDIPFLEIKPSIKDGMRSYLLLPELNFEKSAKVRLEEHQVVPVLILGDRTAGRSNFLDNLINHFWGIKFSDHFRYDTSTIDGETGEEGSEQFNIRVYIIRPKKGKGRYTLKIIQVFGPDLSSEKVLSDENIIDKIAASTKTLHAVCFLMRASNATCTIAQQAFCFKLLQRFQLTIEQNFIFILTFANGKNPDFLKKNKVPNFTNAVTLKFNNATLYANNGLGGDREFVDFNGMFWELEAKCFEDFFKMIDSIKKNHLVDKIIQMRTKVFVGLCQLCKLQATAKTSNHTLEATLECEVLVYYLDKIHENPEGSHCLVCNVNCDKTVTFPPNATNATSKNFSTDPCSWCPRGCRKEMHITNRFEMTFKNELVRMSLGDLRKMYSKRDVYDILQEIVGHFDAIQYQVLCLMDEIRKLLNIIDSNDSRPITILEYIDLLIYYEETQRKTGWSDRVIQLWNAWHQAKRIYSDPHDAQEFLKRLQES